MIVVSNELKCMLKNTLQKTRQMVVNDVVNVKVADRQKYYMDVFELLQHFSCLIMTANHSDRIELKTNGELEEELKEIEEHTVMADMPEL